MPALIAAAIFSPSRHTSPVRASRTGLCRSWYFLAAMRHGPHHGGRVSLSCCIRRDALQDRRGRVPGRAADVVLDHILDSSCAECATHCAAPFSTGVGSPPARSGPAFAREIGTGRSLPNIPGSHTPHRRGHQHGVAVGLAPLLALDRKTG